MAFRQSFFCNKPNFDYSCNRLPVYPESTNVAFRGYTDVKTLQI